MNSFLSVCFVISLFKVGLLPGITERSPVSQSTSFI